MVNVNKLAYFQAITGLKDFNLCVDILNAHGWDLELAISSFTLKSISKLKNVSLLSPLPQMKPPALKLVMVQGLRKGETLEFILGSKVRIDHVVRGNNLPIKDSGISSKHLLIESELGKWVLRDLDSSNCTVLNGPDIPQNTPMDLTNGDEIKFDEYTSFKVKIARYEENWLRQNPRRATTAVEATAVPISESRGRKCRVANESKEITEVERANVEEIKVAWKRGRGQPPSTRVLKTEAADEKPVEENLAQQVSTRQTRSSRIEELGKIPGTAGTSTVSDADGEDGLCSIPQPSYLSG